VSIFCIRHGETVWNRERRIQGRLDSPLTARGIQLASAYAQHLRERLVQTRGQASVPIHSSPQPRAHQTAVVVAEILGQDARAIVTDDRLRERSFGTLEGLTADEVRDQAGISREEFKAWDYRPPQGEAPADVLTRVRGWLLEPRDEPLVIVVCHGGVSRALRAAHLGLDARTSYQKLGPHDHGRYFELVPNRQEVHEHVVDGGAAGPDAPLI